MKIFAFSSDAAASYALPVRRASALPAASFRFHLAADTLAVRLPVPPAGSGEDFHLQVDAPCRAHKKKGRTMHHRPALDSSPTPVLHARNHSDHADIFAD
ncbi:hypothetical protein GD604_12310 [Desulfolutivibrio sulfoxidireducens]|nr:hypothetical protein GD604_12310 [Desulfolutivibrio sulfoxidireducens]